MPTETLSQFLRKVDQTLQIAVDSRAILFREELREQILTAWNEVVRNRLISYTTQVENVEKEEKEPKFFGEHGLTGSELTPKLTGFDLAFETFKKWGTVRLLKKLLRWINSILGSLIESIPGGGAIKEFKELIENAIEE
jgi:hypothetical protein